MTTRVFTRAELETAVRLTREGVDAIAEGFALLSRGAVRQPPILRVDVPEHHGEVDVKSAYVAGWDTFAVKVSTGFFDNPAKGLATGGGLMILLSAETGAVGAVLLDEGYLTSVRTALAGAVAARLLAPERVDVAGIIGAGDQARWQLRALALVRTPREACVWSRNREAAERYAVEMAAELGLRVTPGVSAEEVVASSDVVITTTPSQEPVVQGEWLRKGQHITAVGSDAESKRELAGDVVRRADLFACDHLGQSRRLGELRAVDAAGEGLERPPIELGSIVAGEHLGRTEPSQLTVCDLTGTGVQDTVIARIAVERCAGMKLGRSIDTASY